MSNIASDAKACFSSKVEYCAVIQYLYLKGKTGKVPKSLSNEQNGNQSIGMQGLVEAF